MSNKRTGRRKTATATRLASTHASASAALLPRAVRRGRAHLRQPNAIGAEAPQGEVLEFLNPDGYANIDYTAAAPNVTTDHATFEIWIKTVQKGQTMLFNGANILPWIIVDNDQMLVYWNGAGAGPFNSGWLSADTTPITDGQWHHIAVAFNNGAMTFYKDGIATADTFTVSNSVAAGGDMNLGAAFDGAQGFVGQLYDARVWSVARAGGDIAAQRFTPPTGTEPNLVAATRFDIATNSTINKVDNASHSITGGQAALANLPGPAGLAVQFDGTNETGIEFSQFTAPTAAAITLEAWIQTSVKTTQVIFASEKYYLSVTNDQLTLTWYPLSLPIKSHTSPDTRPVTDGGWHHVAVVVNQGTVTFYKDGIPTADNFTITDAVTSLVPTTNYVIGSFLLQASLVNANFNGLICDARIWFSARNTAEIGSFMYVDLTTSASTFQAAGLALLVQLTTTPQPGYVNAVNGESHGLNSNTAIVSTELPSQPLPTNVWTYPTPGTSPLGPVWTSQGLIYAENVAADVGDTKAGSYLRSRDTQTNTLNWTYPVKGYTQLTTPVIPPSLLVSQGVAYIGAQEATTLGNVVEVHAVNVATGLPIWSKPWLISAPTLLTRPVPFVTQVNGQVEAWIGVATNGFSDQQGNTAAALFWTDVTSGQNQSNFRFSSVSGGYGSAASMTEPIVQDGVVYVGVNYQDGHHVVYALNIGATPYSIGFQPQMSAPISALTLSGNLLYAVCQDGSVTALQTDNNGAVAWSKMLSSSAINGAPTVIGTTLYVGSTDGILYALDGATGNALWPLDTKSPIITDLVVADGVLNFATQGNGSDVPPAFLSVDPLSLGNDVLSYPVPDADTILFAEGAANGVVYFYGKQVIYAVNMDNIEHEFSVESKLIVEDYATDHLDSNNNPVPTDTSYRVTLSLFDPLKNPRVNQAVKVWSSGTLYLANMTDPQGTRLSIGPSANGPNGPMWLETDASGKVTLAVSAYDDGTHGGIGTGNTPAAPNLACPALYAWANFMMPGEAIVIYPDHEHLGNLANVQGPSSTTGASSQATEDALMLGSATGYDGQPLILSQYQDSASLTAIASAIRNTIGTRNPSTASGMNVHSVRGSDPSTADKYQAFPGRMPNVAYQSNSSLPTTRAFVPGADKTWTCDLSSGKPAYQSDVFDWKRPSQLINAAHPNGAVVIQSVQAIDSIGDFFHNVVKGAEKVGKVAWQWTENAVTTIIHTAEGLYNLTITSLEDAVTVVLGFLKSVVADIRELIEWLSFLFGWGDILANHNLIKQLVTNPSDPSKLGMLDQLKNWVNTQVAAINNGQSSDVDTVFDQRLKGNGKSSIGTSASVLNGQTVQNVQGSNSDPNAPYNTGGQNNATQCQWMQQKMMEHSGGVSVPLPPSQHRYYLPFIHNQPGAQAVQPGTSASPSLRPARASDASDAWNAFVSTLKSTVASEVVDFPQQWQAAQDKLKDKLKDSGSILSNGLADILTVFQVLADDMIDLARKMAGPFLTMVAAILDDLITWLDTTINIPFISPLYKLITGDDLSLFDLIALLAAVPATILMKVITGSATPGTLTLGVQSAGDTGSLLTLFMGIVNFILGAITTFLDTLSYFISAFQAGVGTNFLEEFITPIDLVADTLVWVFGMITSFAWNTWETKDWMFWAIQGWPMLQSLVTYVDPNTTNEGIAKDIFFGLQLVLQSGIYAGLFKDSYRDARNAPGLVISANLFGALSYLVEVAHYVSAETEGLGDAIVVAGKFMFEGVSAVLNFTSFVLGWKDSSLSALPAPAPIATSDPTMLAVPLASQVQPALA